MEVLLDTADINKIRKTLEYYPIDGITTNPSILSSHKDDLKNILKELKYLLTDNMTIHVQTTENESKKIINQAKLLTDYYGPNFHIKIPVNNQGIRAVKALKEMNLKVTVTAIFTPMQALIAAKAGADYVAPYVNRIDNITGNGVLTVTNLTNILNRYNFKTKVLGASFKNVQQIYELSIAGCQAVTVTPDLIENMIYHPYTEKSLKDFESDWESSFGNKHIVDFI